MGGILVKPSEMHDLHDLPRHVHDIEAQLSGLDEALRTQDSSRLEQAAKALHKTLADALVACRHAQQVGQEPLPVELRQKLLLAQARVAGLQTITHRASSSIERTLAILFSTESAPTYAAPGFNANTGAVAKAYRG